MSHSSPEVPIIKDLPIQDEVLHYLSHELSGEDYIILLHDNPDPDALACGLGISTLLTHLGKKSSIYYHGTFSHIQNRVFENVIKTNATRTDALDVETIRKTLDNKELIIVDTSCHIGEGNLLGALAFFEGKKPRLVIDHHHNVPQGQNTAYFFSNVGACATQVYNLLRRFNVEIDRRLATALYIAIKLDTDHLRSSSVTDYDKVAHDELAKLIDPEKFIKIMHYPKPESIMALRGKCYSSIQQNGNLVFSNAGIILPEQKSMIAEISDEILRTETVRYCCVFAIINYGQTKAITVSFRNTGDVINTHDFMTTVFGKNFGGRDGAGSGIMELDPLLSELIETSDTEAKQIIIDSIANIYYQRVLIEKSNIS